MLSGRAQARARAMSPEQVRELLLRVRRGAVSLEEAEEALVRLPFDDLGFARVDHHRELRQGMPEVVFGQGKTPEQIKAIGESVAARGQPLLITRLSPDKASAVQQLGLPIEYQPVARVGMIAKPLPESAEVSVLIVSAGTSDQPVVEEARCTLAVAGVAAEVVVDCGVAGLHRLLAELERLRRARIIIVVAGMEGALASVIGGLVAAPVIAVPTSVGYGVGSGGFAALAGMLTSCAAGLTCVNIDNGYGAAMAALRILGCGRREDTHAAS